VVNLIDFAHAQHVGPFGLKQSAHIALKRRSGIARGRHKKR